MKEGGWLPLLDSREKKKTGCAGDVREGKGQAGPLIPPPSHFERNLQSGKLLRRERENDRQVVKQEGREVR